jgi:hypothetical protein
MYDHLAIDDAGPTQPVRDGVFSGGTHRVLLKQRADTGTWSTASMSWIEVQSLLGKYRGRRPR